MSIKNVHTQEATLVLQKYTLTKGYTWTSKWYSLQEKGEERKWVIEIKWLFLIICNIHPRLCFY